MAKVQIKSEKLTSFGGIFSIMEQLIHYSNIEDCINKLLANALLAIEQQKKNE